MLIEVALAVACVVFIVVITSKGEKRKNILSSDAAHPLHDKKKSNGLFASAKDKLNKNQYKDALRDIDQALNLEPAERSYLWLRAKIYISLQQTQEAILDCNTILAIDDTYHWAYAVRGKAYFHSKQYTKALEDLEQVLILKPDFEEAHIDRIRVYFAMDDIETGNAIIEKLLRQDNDSLKRYSTLTAIHYEAMLYAKAIEYGNKVINSSHISKLSNKSQNELYHFILQSHYHLKQYDEAIKIFDSLIELSPDNNQHYNSRSWFKSYVGNYEGAFVDVEKAISLDTSKSHYYSTRGQTKWLMKDYAGAIEDFKHAVELSDDDIYQLETAITLLKLNKQDEAISLWKEVTSEEAEFQSAEAYQEKYRFAPPFYEAMQELEILAQNTD